MNQGQTVFAQLVALLPRKAFDNAVHRHRGDRRVRNLSCMDQLLCMLFAQITGRSSLRETVSCLDALGTRSYHLGFRGRIVRSTLADANERRDFRIFEQTAMAMIAAARLELPTDPDLQSLGAEAYAIDSTTIDLCLKLFPWAHFRRRKAGVKAHTMLDLHTQIPVFLSITHAKRHDLLLLDLIDPQAGAFYVMDKGYIDFERLYRFHTAGAFFVTRARKDMNFGVRGRRAVKPNLGVRADRLIRLRGVLTKKRYPDTLRLISFADPKSGKRLKFLTNNLTLDADIIAMLYRKRWRIELFFKWIKQHLHIKAFFGTTPNAVKVQMWIAVIAYLLVLRLKHRYRLGRETNEIMQILSVTILEKTPANQLFCKSTDGSAGDGSRNQPSLFDL